jgi:hypothetical protein
MRYLALILLLAGCSSTKPELPKQPDAPTNGAVVQSLGKELDKTDSRVGAAIVVAAENLDKPAVAKAELGVASSYLPVPSEGDVAFARQRAAKADAKAYAEAMDFGKKLLAKIDGNWAKMEADQKEAKRVSELKDARIADLQKEIIQIKQDASRNVWSLTGAGLVVLGGIACAFASIRIGIPILLAGAFAGAIPFIIDSPYFEYVAGATLVAISGLGLWWLFDKVRDSVKNDVPPSPIE